MDRKQIMHGGGNSSIEFCDILTKGGAFIHAKKYGGSAVLSHLFNQGYVSAELFISDTKFRKAVQKKVGTNGFSKLIPKDRPEASKYQVVYAIIQHKPKKGDFKMPFFSKVALRRCKKVLEAYNYKVHLNWIYIK